MTTALLRYEASDPLIRLSLVVAIAVLLNGIYCLAYTYSAGHPATLWEAFSWGVVNVAPWIAAIEIGRNATRISAIVALILAAAMASLVLGAAAMSEAPNLFEAIRRIPGMVTTTAVLVGINLFRRSRSRKHSEKLGQDALRLQCDWVRAAGNYVELHGHGRNASLVRSTLAGLVNDTDRSLVQIHRSFAVDPRSIERVERSHVLLQDGTRLPIGNAYRARLGAV